MKYQAYGKPVIILYDQAAAGNPYYFTARELDAETGLYYYRARYYDWHRGAFTQEDFLGFEGGDLNLFRYVKNDPLNYSDPYGTLSVPFLGWIDAGECQGLKSAEWYAERFNDSGTLGKIMYGAGGLGASLWTPDTSNYTAITLGLGFLSSQALKALNIQQTLIEFKRGTRWLQIRPADEKPYFRLDVEKGRPHYHRRPDLTKHRPWEEGW